MRRIVPLLFLSFLSVTLHAQKMTGIWRGYFVSGIGIGQQKYRYELQILESANGALKGVSYSYKTTVFYGKASVQGIYTAKTRNIIFTENKLMEVKVSDQSEPCLMTCYLDYSKAGSIEVLQGTFTSLTVKGKNDCGSGTVYLERVLESDFQKEDFLVKKSTTPRPNTVNRPKSNTTEQRSNTTKSTAGTKPKPKPNSNNKRQDDAPNVRISSLPKPDDDVSVPETRNEKKGNAIPWVLKQRESTLVRTIQTNKKEIKIELFDNGEIDNDTITVYHNNSLVTYKRKLSATPITIKVNATDDEPFHEFVMVADNLGSIPPNTALMVITTGGKRYELFISSDQQKNAKVIIEYRPGE